MKKAKTEILIYQSKDGIIKIDVKLENETIWLNQYQLAELFQTDRTSHQPIGLCNAKRTFNYLTLQLRLNYEG